MTGAAGSATPPSKASGLLFGIGLGGFLDGIVLHQILQWHHMLSHVLRDLTIDPDRDYQPSRPT
jgi:uncharacterized membrane protein